MDAIKVKLIGLSRGGGGNLQPDKTVTPTEQDQTVRPDPGYDGLRQVTVEAIPDQYADVSGVDAGAVDVRVGKVIVGSDGETIIGTMPPQKPEQSKAVIPTKETQTVEPDEGYALSLVEVDAIPDEFPDVSDTTATPETVLLGMIFYGSDGERKVGEYQSVDTLAQYFADTLTDIEDSSVTTLIPSFFEGKIALQRVEFDNLTTIGNRAFFGCADLVSIIAPLLYQVGNEAFRNCLKLRAISLENLTTINEYAFDGCAALTELNCPNASNIGNYAFQNCTGLTELNLPNASNIGNYAFQNCTGLTKLDLPNAYSIGSSTFFDCTGLTELDLPNAYSIGGYAYRNCVALTVLNLPSFTTAGDRAIFMGCTSLKSVSLPMLTDTKNAYGSDGMFGGCTSLESVDFGALTRIGNFSFFGATAFGILVIRSASVPTLANVNAFNGTRFASGQSGGTLYCHQNLISQYEQATNWSVILAYPNNQILPIEGSPYEVTT